MIITQDGNISIITQEKFTVVELVKKLEALYPKFKNNNIIVVLTSLKELTIEKIVEFLQISNIHRKEKHSFIIVCNNINLNDIPDELIVVPTQKEAYDIIEMEEMERDLGI